MSSEYSIRLQNVSKTYPVYKHPTDRLKQLLFPWRSQAYFKAFPALHGVNLDVKRGHTVGIIGRNGAGKSTLLQVLCGISPPTSGSVEVNGRVAPLLSLGAGFTPEYSGRENIKLSASIQGLSEAEIRDRMASIIAFADIGDYIEQPVKTYSSGMYSRLAFAVAISVDPDILVVDEALAVGDEAFQRKCFSRIEEIRRNGGTILFVSHSAGAILQLCDHALLLDQGEILAEGAPNLVVNYYHRLAFAPGDKRPEIRESIRTGKFAKSLVEAAEAATESGTIRTIAAEVADAATYDPHLRSESVHYYDSRGATISDIAITDENGRPVNLLTQGARYTLNYKAHFDADAHMVRFSMLIKTAGGLNLGGCTSHPAGDGISVVAKDTHFDVSFHFRTDMHAEAYFVNAGILGIVDGEEVYLHRIVDAAMIKVLPNSRQIFTGHANLMESTACEIVFDPGKSTGATN